MLYRTLLPLALACFAWAGCLTTAKHTRTADGFSPADLDRIAVVFSTGIVGDRHFGSFNPDSAASASANEQVPRLLRAYAPAFGLTLVDAREALAHDSLLHANALAALDTVVTAIRRENIEVARTPFAAGFAARNAPLDRVVADDLIALSARTGTRHLLAVNTVGWERSTGEKIVSGLIGGVAALFGAIPVGGAPSRVALIETMLIDTEREAVVWYSARGAEIDPQNPDHLAALARTVAFELFDGRRIAPQSFLSPLDHDAVVYRFGEPRITGRVTGIEGMNVVIETRDGMETIPLHEVKSIRGFGGTGKLFPLPIPVAE